MARRRSWARRARLVLVLVPVVATVVTAGFVGRAAADSFVPVSGAGSTWSQNAIDQWRRDVEQYGQRINYAGTGSSDGRRQFINGTVDFAASDIPFQAHPEDGSAPEIPTTPYAYMPITAGGTVFAYNLHINGQRVTNLRLSGTNVAKIFTGVIKSWNDAAIVADNPGLTLPNQGVVPVVRSDGSGSTAQFSLWMINTHPDIWNAYCRTSGRAPACGETSQYPTVTGMIAQSGDLGVMGYVQQNYAEGAIGYVNYSYALNANFPVAKLLNNAGYYTEPTANNVAVSLLKAQINNDPASADFLTQKLDGVYSDTDSRNYQLSSYSYLILPTKVVTGSSFSNEKGKTLAAFAYYAMCQGQQQAPSLGYSPMPINLVQASFDQIKKVPGAVVQNIIIQSCNNPTFSPDGTNVLARDAPQPQACDKQGPTQCATGTGGAKAATPVKGAAAGAAAGAAGGQSANTVAGSRNSNNTTGTTVPGSVTTVVGSADQQCNPDTGGCLAVAIDNSGQGQGQGQGQVAASPYTLARAKGWTGTQTLMLLVLLLTVALILAPGVASRYLRRRDPG